MQLKLWDHAVHLVSAENTQQSGTVHHVEVHVYKERYYSLNSTSMTSIVFDPCTLVETEILIDAIDLQG